MILEFSKEEAQDLALLIDCALKSQGIHVVLVAADILKKIDLAAREEEVLSEKQIEEKQ